LSLVILLWPVFPFLQGDTWTSRQIINSHLGNNRPTQQSKKAESAKRLPCGEAHASSGMPGSWPSTGQNKLLCFT
jgi:hypothetical protein